MEIIKLLDNKIELLQQIFMDTLQNNSKNLDISYKLFLETLSHGNTVFWCGNGGSASESSHLATELIGRFKKNRDSLPSICLNADTSAITCIANDFGYENIFSRQLEGLARKEDILIVLSTSGLSVNILKVLKRARSKGCASIALLGKNGGEAKSLADYPIVVESDETARIQEVHLLIGHTFCELAEIDLGY